MKPQSDLFLTKLGSQRVWESVMRLFLSIAQNHKCISELTELVLVITQLFDMHQNGKTAPPELISLTDNCSQEWPFFRLNLRDKGHYYCCAQNGIPSIFRACLEFNSSVYFMNVNVSMSKQLKLRSFFNFVVLTNTIAVFSFNIIPGRKIHWNSLLRSNPKQAFAISLARIFLNVALIFPLLPPFQSSFKRWPSLRWQRNGFNEKRCLSFLFWQKNWKKWVIQENFF